MTHPAFRFARCGLLALLVTPAYASNTSELQHELDRELHKMPPAATLPTPQTLACYERLGKIARFAPLPIRSEPAQCATIDLVRLDRVLMPDGAAVAVNPPPTLLAAWPSKWRSSSAPMSARPRPSSARRSPPSPIWIPTSAGRATTSPARNCPSTARATPSTSAR